MVAPHGTPPAVVQKIADLFAEAMRNQDVVKRLGELGAAAAISSPAEFKKFLIEDRAKWQRLAEQAHLRANGGQDSAK